MQYSPLEPPLKKASKKNFLGILSSKNPPTKWRGKASIADRARIHRDFINLQAQLRGEAMGSLPREYRSIFQSQLNKFKDEALVLGSRTRISSKAKPDESWSDEEVALVIAILVEAARLAFVGDIEMLEMARSKYQSLIDRGYSRARFVLGEADGITNPRLASRNQSLLNNTILINLSSFGMVEKRIQREVLKTNLLREGTSWGNIIQAVVASATQRVLATPRLTTVARTEGGRAVDEGIKEAFKKSQVVSHCSVIGCMGIEPKIPTYNGIPTCNIQDVPVEDVDMVEFHINHTGVWVASQFNE